MEPQPYFWLQPAVAGAALLVLIGAAITEPHRDAHRESRRPSRSRTPVGKAERDDDDHQRKVRAPQR